MQWELEEAAPLCTEERRCCVSLLWMASDVTRSVARPKRLSERGVVATNRLPSARPNQRAALSMPVALHFTLHILSARVWYVATLTQTPPRVHRPRRRVFLEFCTLEPQLCGCAYDPQVRAYG